MQGAPDVSDLIEHDRKIVGPMQRLQSQVYNTGAPSLAFAEIDAATLLLVWLHSEAIIKRLAAEIDTEADDEAALSHETRQQREAEVQGDLLGVERDEAALVWLRSNVCSPVEHRADISPLALLGVRLVTSPRATELRETSPGYKLAPDDERDARPLRLRANSAGMDAQRGDRLDPWRSPRTTYHEPRG